MPEPLVIWRLTDGKPGHMQQTLGLVSALSALVPCDVVDMDVAAQPVGALDLALGRFTPGLARTKPHLIVGAGHATHLALLAARRMAGGRIVVLMKPSLPSFLFDFIVAPEHDGLEAGSRVINTLGVLNPMHPAAKQPDSLLFLIGGPSKHVRWEDAAVLDQLAAVVAALQPGVAWRIADSRRTPESLRAVLQQQYGGRFQPYSQCPPGWLAEQLAQTGTVWATEDSVSMVYEALTAGCRVGLLRLPGANRKSRVMTGVEALVADERVTAFEDWSCTGRLRPPRPFNEASRVAATILERIPVADGAG